MEQNERETLKHNLQRMNARVRFSKATGEIREMNCTLRKEAIPAPPTKKKTETQRKTNPDVLPVWDLDENAWRSFRYENVLDVVYNIA